MRRKAQADPYRTAPSRAFWSRAVAREFSPAALVASTPLLIRPGERVASAGSCFAANVVPFLEGAGFTYVRTEPPHPLFADIAPEALGYGRFSAAYGNIYTARQMLQLIRRATRDFRPVEDRWPTPEGIVDPFRPGLRYRARTDREFDALTAQHLTRTLQALTGADVFVFTLGLTEAWLSREDGAVFPACPGTVAGTFDPERHVFRNFTVAEVVADLETLLALLRTLNPAIRLVLTVSPVPLVATATGGHVLVASTYSKSVLRAACGEVCSRIPEVVYFPAYEIVSGPQAPESYFESDRRNVSEAGIRAAMTALLAACGAGMPQDWSVAAHPAPPSSSAALSAALNHAECEEQMADLLRHGPHAPPSGTPFRRLYDQILTGLRMKRRSAAPRP